MTVNINESRGNYLSRRVNLMFGGLERGIRNFRNPSVLYAKIRIIRFFSCTVHNEAISDTIIIHKLPPSAQVKIQTPTNAHTKINAHTLAHAAHNARSTSFVLSHWATPKAIAKLLVGYMEPVIRVAAIIEIANMVIGRSAVVATPRNQEGLTEPRILLRLSPW